MNLVLKLVIRENFQMVLTMISQAFSKIKSAPPPAPQGRREKRARLFFS
jgi:hypothetical protein